MAKQKKAILVATDLESNDAADQLRGKQLRTCAATLSQKLNASLELVYVEDLTLYPISQPVYKDYIHRFVSEKKRSLEKLARSTGVPTVASVLEGYPSERLISLSSKVSKYEMLVVASHGRKGLQRSILGSVAEEVVRNSKVPVLVLGPQAQKSSKDFFLKKSMRILVSSDLSHNSKRAEAYARSLAQTLSAEVILFHASVAGFYPRIQPAFMSPGFDQDFELWLEKLRPQIQKQAALRAETFKKGKVPCKVFVDENSLEASSALMKAVKKFSPDLVVMGTHGRSLLTGAFFGNTAREMILSSPVPVIVVRSF